MDLNSIIDSYRDEIVKTIQDFVKIKSVEESPQEGKPFGEGPYNALMYALDIGEKLGFKVENFDGYAGHVEYGDGEEIVGVLTHVDVVPEGNGWTYPPYSGEIHDGKIYGRGSYDDKGGCIAALYALKALKDSGVMPERKVRIIFGANEETGMADIPYYLKKNKEPDIAFSPDSPFPVVYGEKGILDLVLTKKSSETNLGEIVDSIYGGDMPKMIPGSCKAYINPALETLDSLKGKAEEFNKGRNGSIQVYQEEKKITIQAAGKSSSAMYPENSINAISCMMEFLDFLNLPEGDLRSFVGFYNDKIGYNIYGEGLGCACTDEVSTPLTLCPTVICFEGKDIKLHIHIRYPVKGDYDCLIEKISHAISQYNIEMEVVRHSKAHYIPKDSLLVSTLMDVYREEMCAYDAEPVTMTGGTYARTMKNAVAFGPLFPGEKQVAHEANEYLMIDSIIKATKIYAKALYKLSI